MTKAIFKIYENNKFVLGAWVKSDGGVKPNSLFPYVMKSEELEKYQTLKRAYYNAINQYIQDHKFLIMSGDKKNPFWKQMDSQGMKAVDVLFWENNLSDKKLLKENLWGEYIYEIRLTNKQMKVKVDYSNNTREWINKNEKQHDEFISKMLQEVVEWVDNIDFGLNDCDCDKEQTN